MYNSASKLHALIAPKHIAVQAASYLAIDSKPLLVPIAPSPTAKRRHCYFNVQHRIKDRGGDMVMGWAVTYMPRTLIECVHHAVWRSPDGKLMDVTPNLRTVRAIMFLPDPAATYADDSGVNIRFPLTDAPEVRDFIEIPLEPALTVAEMRRRELLEEKFALYLFTAWSKDAPCICGGKKAYKGCCYSRITASLKEIR